MNLKTNMGQIGYKIRFFSFVQDFTCYMLGNGNKRVIVIKLHFLTTGVAPPTLFFISDKIYCDTFK